jgi:hypothetical protein
MSDKLYPFDADFIEVAFNARPNSESPLIVYHKLRKPTLQELIEREGLISYEIVELNSREEELKADEDTANARLWDKIILQVKGYRGAEDWRDLSEEEKAAMRPGHKSTAIRAMYAANCEIEGDEDGVSISADTWTVRQEIGVGNEPDYVVRHTLREPTEAERAKYKRSASSTSYIKGAKKARVMVRTNLRAYIELYDALIQVIEGGTFGGDVGAYLELFKPAIDPIWKRLVIHTLMSTLEAQLSD